MRTSFAALLTGSFAAFSLSSCNIQDNESWPGEPTVGINAPEFVRAGLCEYFGSIEIGVNLYDQYSRPWQDVAVICTVGMDIGIRDFAVDTVFSGSTSDSGEVLFHFPVQFVPTMVGEYEIRAWAEGYAGTSRMWVLGANVGPGGVTLCMIPDTLLYNEIPGTILVRSYFWYVDGGPANEVFRLRAETGTLTDSVLQVTDWVVETNLALPDSLAPGRYSVTLDYSESPCQDLFDTAWVTILP